MRISIIKSVILVPVMLLSISIALLFIASFIGYFNLIVRVFVSGF